MSERVINIRCQERIGCLASTLAISVCVHTHTHTHIYVCVYICMHTHTHIYILRKKIGGWAKPKWHLPPTFPKDLTWVASQRKLLKHWPSLQAIRIQESLFNNNENTRMCNSILLLRSYYCDCISIKKNHDIKRSNDVKLAQKWTWENRVIYQIGAWFFAR